VPLLYVDSHCHLDRYDDPERVLAAAKRDRVVVVAVTETPADFARQSALLDDDRYLRPALGAHPLLAGRFRASEIERFFAALGRTEYVGEIGLDLSNAGKPTARRQFEVFERILADARVRTKVLTIHSRGAAAETIERLEQAGAVGILHWYSGSLAVAERALSAGQYFSVNASMLRSKRGRRLVEALPRERVLTETDGPYCKVGSRPSTPSDIVTVVAGLAELWSLTETESANLVIENLVRLRSVVMPQDAVR
jgi:TatD DNase family protein